MDMDQALGGNRLCPYCVEPWLIIELARRDLITPSSQRDR